MAARGATIPLLAAILAMSIQLPICDGAVTLSKVLVPRPVPSSQNLFDGEWAVPGYMFIYATFPGDGSMSGHLMYLNISDAAKMGTFKRPLSALLASGNVVQYSNSGSYPGNPDIMEPLPKSRNVIKGPGSKGATLRVNSPLPSGQNPPRSLTSITAQDLLSPSTAFVLSGDVYGSLIKRACFSDPMVTITPVEYPRLRTVRAGSDRYETVMRIGRGFGSLLISQSTTRPVEIVLVPRGNRLSVLWPTFSRTEPIHSSPLTSFRTYVVGSGLSLPDREYKSMADMAECADESIDAQFQTARLHIDMLLFATNDRADEDPFLMRVVLTRLFMAIFSQVQNTMSSGYAVLEDLLTSEINLKMVLTSIPFAALGGNTASGFLETQSPLADRAVKKSLTTALSGAMTIAATSTELEKRWRALAASYALLDQPGRSAVEIATKTLEEMHWLQMRGWIKHNTTVSKAAFYSVTVSLGRGPVSPAAMATGRKILLLVTSMCTDDKAAEWDVDVQEAYVTVTKLGQPFDVTAVYSPCAAALRTDFSEYTHRLYSQVAALYRQPVADYLAGAPGFSGPAEEARLEGAALRAEARWRSSHPRIVQEYMPEVVACGAEVLSDTVMLLPLGVNSTFVVGRKNWGNGVVYRVDGVSVSNQLYVTYASGVCGSSFMGTIDSTKLPKPAPGTCPYCGCAVLRYDASGAVKYGIYVASESLQSELIAGDNSSVGYFNPSVSGGLYGTTLLLFPNGTVVRVLAFETEKKTALSTTYIVSAAVGAVLAVILLGVTIRMIVAAVRGQDRESPSEVGSRSPAISTRRRRYRDGSSGRLGRRNPRSHKYERITGYADSDSEYEESDYV